jgi:hypothetical protein
VRRNLYPLAFSFFFTYELWDCPPPGLLASQLPRLSPLSFNL